MPRQPDQSMLYLMVMSQWHENIRVPPNFLFRPGATSWFRGGKRTKDAETHKKDLARDTAEYG